MKHLYFFEHQLEKDVAKLLLHEVKEHDPFTHHKTVHLMQYRDASEYRHDVNFHGSNSHAAQVVRHMVSKQ
jgi:hypothetical protein